MNERAYSFLVGVLGRDGAEAFKKATEKEATLSSAVVPRAIVSWLNLATKYEYEGEIPGVENTYLQFRKTEGPGYNGAISLGEDVYSFQNASTFHLVATVAVALGVEDAKLDPAVRDLTVSRLGKSIDTLVKARVALEELQTKNLEKKILDPNFGYKFTHEHHDLGPQGMLTKVNVHSPAGEHVGAATFTHKGNNIVPGTVIVEDEHQRRGIASAMYAHAQKQTGKTLMPSSNQTPEGQALWAGNMKQPQFGAPATKTELPGQTHKPTPQAEPMNAQAPQFQQAQPKPPKKTGLKITKSQSEKKCTMCARPQFNGDTFVGCLCFRDLAKHVKASRSDNGYVLVFKSSEWDADAIQALAASMRSA